MDTLTSLYDDRYGSVPFFSSISRVLRYPPDNITANGRDVPKMADGILLTGFVLFSSLFSDFFFFFFFPSICLLCYVVFVCSLLLFACFVYFLGLCRPSLDACQCLHFSQHTDEVMDNETLLVLSLRLSPPPDGEQLVNIRSLFHFHFFYFSVCVLIIYFVVFCEMEAIRFFLSNNITMHFSFGLVRTRL